MVPPLRILIVEDDDVFAALVGDLLAGSGGAYTAETCRRLDQALARLARDVADCVLLDLNLPDSAGLDTFTSVHRAFPGIPVVILTGLADDELALRALSAGAQDYINKNDIDREILRRSVRYAIGRQAADDRLCQAEEERRRTTLELAQSSHELGQILESISEGFYALDERFVVTHFNAAAERTLGRARADVVGRPLFDAFPEARGSIFEHEYARAMRERQPVTLESYFPVAPYANWYEVRAYPRPNGLAVFFRVITERKRAEEAGRISRRLLELAARTGDMQALLDESVRAIHEFAGCAAAGIRIIEADGTIPYRAYVGLSREFFERECRLSLAADDCTCTRVVRGEGPPAGSTCVTPGGSFFCGSLTRLFASLGEDAKSRMRGECHRAGYETVAVVPIRGHAGIIGAIHLADAREHALPVTTVEALEIAAGDLAAAVARARAEAHIARGVARLQALREIDQAITASFDPRVTLGILLDRTRSQLAVDAADVLLQNPHAPVLEYAAGSGFRTRVPLSVRLRLGDGLAGRAALERRTLAVEDLSAERSAVGRSSLFREEGFASYVAVPLLVKGRVRGVLETFLRRPFRPDTEWIEFLEALAGQAAIAIDNALLVEDLQRTNVDLALAYDSTIEGWSRALDLRDKETEGHSLRVTEMTARLARATGFSEADLVHVRRGALLHDIGKVGIPDAILLKPGPLSDEEWVIMRRHPTLAHELLSPIGHLERALDIPWAHHEKWDGTGYPRGLKGPEIPIAARAFAIVDVWDALRSDRPYRKAWPEEKTRSHVAGLSGSHFDPRVADAFLAMDWSGFHPRD